MYEPKQLLDIFKLMIKIKLQAYEKRNQLV